MTADGQPCPHCQRTDCSGKHSLTWHVGDQALAKLTEECMLAGLDEQQTYRIWKIMADAFNRLTGVGA